MIRNIVQPIISSIISDITDFDPLDLSPLAWWDASDETTITTSGSAVTQWDDKSGNDYHVSQGTGANQPAFANDTISFDGSTDYLFRSSSFMYSASNTVTVFMVMECGNSSEEFFIAEGSSSSSTPVYSPLKSKSSDATTGQYFIRNDSGTLANANSTSADSLLAGSTRVYMVEDDLSNITTRVNNSIEVVTAYTRPAAPVTLDRFAIGQLLRNTNYGYADVDVKEIIIFNAALSESQKEQINSHLLNKHQVERYSFDPFSLSPLAWYDATNAGTVITSGSAVTAWNDSSGNGYDLAQATGSNQPTFANDTISFDGSTDYLWRALGLLYSAAGTTVFAVLESSASTSDFILSDGSSTDNDPIYSILRTDTSDSTKLSTTISNDAGSSISGATSATNYFASGTKKLCTIVDNLSSIISTVNGASEVTTGYSRPATPYTFDQFSIGALLRTSVSNHSDVDIDEVIIFNSVLTDDQIAQVNSYLATKHGITL